MFEYEPKLQEFSHVCTVLDSACRTIDLSALSELGHASVEEWTHRPRQKGTIAAIEAGRNRSHFTELPPVWEFSKKIDNVTVHVGVNVSVTCSSPDTLGSPTLSTALVQIDVVPNKSEGTDFFNSAQAMVSVANGVAKIEEVRIGVITTSGQGTVIFKPESSPPRRVYVEYPNSADTSLEESPIINGPLKDNITKFTASLGEQKVNSFAYAAMRAIFRGDMQLKEPGISQSKIYVNEKLSSGAAAIYKSIKQSIATQIGEVHKFAGSNSTFERLCGLFEKCMHEIGILDWVTDNTKWESIPMKYPIGREIGTRDCVRTSFKKGGTIFTLGGNLEPAGGLTKSLVFGCRSEKWSSDSINEVLWMNDIDEVGGTTTAVVLRHNNQKGEIEAECQIILSETKCYVSYFKREEVIEYRKHTGRFKWRECVADDIEQKMSKVFEEIIDKITTISTVDELEIAEKVKRLANVTPSRIDALFPAQFQFEKAERRNALAKARGRDIGELSGAEVLLILEQVESEVEELSTLARQRIVASFEAIIRPEVQAVYIVKQFRSEAVVLVKKMLGIDNV